MSDCISLTSNPSLNLDSRATLLPTVSPCSLSCETVQAVSATLVSCVSNARDTATQHFEAKEIIDSIRTGGRFDLRERIESIRRTFWKVMAETNSDRKAAKKAIDAEKKGLPAATWSATFRRRSQDGLLEPSGLLCGDLDGLGDKIAEVRAKLLSSPYLWAIFLSPTGDGLKCVFRVPANAERHEASFRAVESHVRELTSEPIDRACSDISRLCFLSYDPDAQLNDNAVELPPLLEKEKVSSAAPEVGLTEGEIETRRTIAADLLGDIDWSNKTEGFCTCPGQDKHKTGNGPRDCIVYLDQAPTIYCVHESCLGILEEKNHELRSLIGKAEPRAQNGPAKWFDEKFPSLSDQFGEAVLVTRDLSGFLRVQAIGEDFVAATLGETGSPNAPTVFLAIEEKFHTYVPTEGIFIHQREPVLLTGLSRLLLDCSRECRGSCNTAALRFRLRNAATLGGVLKKARGLLEVPQEFFSTDLTEFIPCANGMLRLEDKALLPFDPKYGRRNKLAVPYEPAAKCPLFLDTLMRPALACDELDLLQRWCGLALVGENIAQRLVILSGTAGGGKGTFIRVLTGLIGPSNVASLRTQLLAERFEVGRLLGKTLLYGADVPANFLNLPGASVLKALTGGDPVTLEFKNSNEKPLITCHFNAVVTCNSKLMVRLEGDIEAWRRRLAIVSYNNAKPDKVIAHLDRQILETEDSGVLNWMIEGLDKLRADEWTIKLTTDQQKVVDDLLLESDGHNLFAREALTRAEGGQLTVENSWGAYVEFCTQRGWKTLLRKDFASQIGDIVVRTYGLTIRHDIKDASGKAQRGWDGLKLRDEAAR